MGSCRRGDRSLIVHGMKLGILGLPSQDGGRARFPCPAIGVGECVGVRGASCRPPEQRRDVNPRCAGGFESSQCGGQRGPGGSADGRVLVAQQILRFGRPGQDLAVQ